MPKVDFSKLPDRIKVKKNKDKPAPPIVIKDDSGAKAIREMSDVVKGAVKATHELSKDNLKVVNKLVKNTQTVMDKAVRQTEIISNLAMVLRGTRPCGMGISSSRRTSVTRRSDSGNWTVMS